MKDLKIELGTIMCSERLPRVAVVVSKTNEFVTAKLLEGALSELHDIGEVTVIEVAGAFEITAASAIAFERGFDGVVALGAVIRGDTPHFDYICQAVTIGLTELSAKGKIIAFGILTANNVGQAIERAGGAMGNKGAEAAKALLQLISAKQRLEMRMKHDAA